MAYVLRREDGELKRRFEITAHHGSPMPAEVRDHEGKEPLIVWYKTERGWEIYVAGKEAGKFLVKK